MTLSPDEARELAVRAVEIATSAGAGHAEAVVIASEHSLTRFADSRIHQNVSTLDAVVSVRAIDGQRSGVSSTNRTSDESALAECCASAIDAARRAPADPFFPGLPQPRTVTSPDRSVDSTRAFGPRERAQAVAAIIEQSVTRGAKAAGGIAVTDQTVAVANSRGVAVSMPVTTYRATVLSMAPDGGSGWASDTGRDVRALAPAALGDRAATLAARSADPVTLGAGVYPVVLAPEAVASVMEMLGWFGSSAKAVDEGRSFMSGHAGERLMSPSITLVDDALSEHACGLTFDFEGMPKQRVAVVDHGVVGDAVTDSYWAARTGRPNTGHALPAPNAFGPLPMDLALEPGDSTPEAMIASLDRGIYVTRFHYVNIEDPIRAVLTGMTRDGTFLIEGGRLTRPVRNLRFTQSAVEALAAVGGVSAERQLVGEETATLSPYLLLEGFAFTGQTT